MRHIKWWLRWSNPRSVWIIVGSILSSGVYMTTAALLVPDLTTAMIMGFAAGLLFGIGIIAIRLQLAAEERVQENIDARNSHQVERIADAAMERVAGWLNDNGYGPVVIERRNHSVH